MAVAILEQRAMGRASPRFAWIASLPETAPHTPPLDFNDAELLAAEDAVVAAEAAKVRSDFVQAGQSDVLAPRLAAIGCGWEDLRRATGTSTTVAPNVRELFFYFQPRVVRG